MTPQILQSDIDLAKRMLQVGAPDADIIAALVRRRIDQESAALLVDDLRHGRAVIPQLELSPEGTLLTSEASPSPVSSSRGASTPGPEGESRRRRRGRRSSGVRKIGLLLGLLLIASGLGGAFLTLYKQYHSRTGALLEHLEDVVNAPLPSGAANPAVSNRTTEAGRPELLSDYQVLLNQLSRRRLDAGEKRRLEEAMRKEQQRAQPGNGGGAPDLEIRQEGVYIGGIRVTARSALQALCQAVGPPARTNQMEQSTNIVYAFDTHGLLLYTQPGAEADYMVLDFDANGGSAGTTSPFIGRLKIDSIVIGRETDAQSLSAATAVNLNRSGPEGGIFKGSWQGTELCVAYLKNQQRPSLIQISLKKRE